MQSQPPSGATSRTEEPIYCIAVPAEEEGPAIERLARGFGIKPSSFRISFPTRLSSRSSVAGLCRFCSRVRGRPHSLFFLESRPEKPHLVIAESHDILFFWIRPEELELGRWFGHPPYPLPDAELFDGLSNSLLERQVREVLELLGSTRLIDLAVYQKLSDIVNRSWES